MEEVAVSIPKKWVSVFFGLIILASWSSFASAQDQNSSRGNLSGIVYDATGGVVPGAKITITGPIGSLTQETTDQGSFLFQTLIPGVYSVRVEKGGFKAAQFKTAEVLINKTTSIEAVLETGQVTEVVEVTAASIT